MGERIAHLFQTVRTGRGVGRDVHPHAPALRLHDAEAVRRGIADRRPLQRLDLRQRRKLGTQAVDEDVACFAPQADFHALAGVAHVAGEAHFLRQPPNGRPETDALHLPTNGEALAAHHATSHNSTRLLPLSAMATRPPSTLKP